MWNILSLKNKKIIFILIWFIINLTLIFTNIYFFYYLYAFIFIHGPVSKILLIFTIIYKKIQLKIKKWLKKEEKIKEYINNIISIIVTCYCESVDEIFNTIKSLEKAFEYSKNDNIIFVVFDGLCIEENTEKYSWELLLNKMTKINLMFENVDYTENWKNYPIKVDLISCCYNNLNIILIIKKTNLGKKDSLNFVRDFSINKLDKELTDKMNILINEYGKKQEDIILVGSMDADCIVNKEGIKYLYDDIKLENVMGVSGIVLPKENQIKNFWYIYQLTEYYNTQYITRLAYNYLNQTTCLPGALNIFDMKYYNKNVREEFQKMPSKKSLFKSLIALIGEDRRFTGLYLENNDKKCKTLINENVHIFTSLPDTTQKFKTQRRRWITSSLLNNIHDLRNKKLSWIIKYNTASTSLFSYLILYIIFMTVYLLFEIRKNFLEDLNIFPYERTFTFYYKAIIYLITFLILIFQVTFLIKMKNFKQRFQYILGVIFFILFVLIIITPLLFYCLYKLDSLNWGNIKQNKEQKVEIVITEPSNEEIEIFEIEMDKFEEVKLELE